MRSLENHKGMGIDLGWTWAAASLWSAVAALAVRRQAKLLTTATQFPKSFQFMVFEACRNIMGLLFRIRLTSPQHEVSAQLNVSECSKDYDRMMCQRFRPAEGRCLVAPPQNLHHGRSGSLVRKKLTLHGHEKPRLFDTEGILQSLEIQLDFRAGSQIEIDIYYQSTIILIDMLIWSYMYI